MVQFVRNYNFTINKDLPPVGCVFDWFEVRVKSFPLIHELEKYGYRAELDKGCATHLHYFETNDFSVSWDIKSSYIEKVWSHFRVKNHVLYGIRGFNSVVDYVISTCMRIFSCSNNDVIISRIDFAYDMSVGSLEHNIIRSRFENRKFPVERYTEFHGKVGYRQFTNYSAGNRGSRVFFRLYYKTIENTDYQTHKPKKEYIYNWHLQLFDNLEVVRFEIEWKPQGNVILCDLIYNRFQEFWEKYVNDDACFLSLGEYQSEAKQQFSKLKAVHLLKLLREYMSLYPESSFCCDVLDGCSFIINDTLKFVEREII